MHCSMSNCVPGFTPRWGVVWGEGEGGVGKVDACLTVATVGTLPHFTEGEPEGEGCVLCTERLGICRPELELAWKFLPWVPSSALDG